MACSNSRECGRHYRKDLQSHLEQHCPWRRVECLQQCGVRVVCREMDKHLNECQASQVPCRVCRQLVRRSGELLHLQHDCPLVEVECPYTAYGCHDRVRNAGDADASPDHPVFPFVRAGIEDE